LKLKPKKVIGFGGRDSFFLLLFSSFLFLDTSIYEPNLKAGKANKILKFFAREVLRGFESKQSRKSKTIGIVLRDNIKRIDKEDARRLLNFNNNPVIFCFGGSQGSSFINDIFMRFVRSSQEEFGIIHLTGQEEYFKFKQLYNTIDRNRFVKDFYYDMEVLYSAADIVVSRSGASTLGEISFYGLPAVLIPHPQGGAHQKENAFYFKERGAAFVYLQNNFSFEEFSGKLQELIHNEDLRRTMGNAAGAINLGATFESFCATTHP
jgi:UDP-N-acetylglucosamine--N-acetylmuramyl-(pentapeptide) pyrophosphoryl-undecaprenol N-acetylglucosamine transferase